MWSQMCVALKELWASGGNYFVYILCHAEYKWPWLTTHVSALQP